MGVTGVDLILANGQAAHLCAVNILVNLLAACDGDLNRMVRLAELVHCTVEFEQQAAVLNAASDLICNLLETAGSHAHIASGMPCTTFG